MPFRDTGTPMPPTDPLIYRFYELIMVNGPALNQAADFRDIDLLVVSLMAHHALRCIAPPMTLLDQQQTSVGPELPNSSAAIDPKRTLVAHCRNGFDAGLRPYRSTHLSR